MRRASSSVLRGPFGDLSKDQNELNDVEILSALPVTCARLIQTAGPPGPSLDVFKHPIFRPPLPVNTLPTMSQSLPSSTTVLVVGAGPAGMACALSLWSSGVRDMVIVDALEEGRGDRSSRAFVLHAATLEVRSCDHSVYQT